MSWPVPHPLIRPVPASCARRNQAAVPCQARPHHPSQTRPATSTARGSFSERIRYQYRNVSGPTRPGRWPGHCGFSPRRRLCGAPAQRCRPGPVCGAEVWLAAPASVSWPENLRKLSGSPERYPGVVTWPLSADLGPGSAIAVRGVRADGSSLPSPSGRRRTGLGELSGLRRIRGGCELLPRQRRQSPLRGARRPGNRLRRLDRING
jgi:hypothetical protein